MLVIKKHLHVTRSGKNGDSSRNDNNGGDSNKSALGLQLRALEQVGATEGTALGTKLGPKDGRAVGPALRLQLGVAEETLEEALERANVGALDGEQVGTTEGTTLGDCSLVSPWEHRKEHWSALRTEH